MKNAALFFLIVLSFVSLVIFFIEPQSISQPNLSAVLNPPDWNHWFGRDQLGRDLFLRVLSGAPLSLGIGLFGSISGFVFGILFGLTATMGPRRLQDALLRFTEVLMALPNLVLLVVLAVFFQAWVPNYLALIFTLAASSWMIVARLTYNLLQKEKSLPYVEAAQAIGGTRFRILFHHLLPNIASPLLVFWTLQIPHAILAESILNFLDLGIQAPGVSWGLLFQEGWRSLTVAPHLLLGPALLLFLTAFSINTLVDDFRQGVLD
jgi:oligopeptide transport system permease protein